MPADVSFEDVSPRTVVSTETAAVRRLPLGLGLTIAACASGGLWIAAAAGIRALFF